MTDSSAGIAATRAIASGAGLFAGSEVFAGRTALVTGAASGIGRATALALAAAGARVLVQDLNGAGVEAVAATIRSQGGEAWSLACSVADEDAVNAAVARVAPVTLLLNNAGVPGFNAALEDIDRAAYDRMFEVHVWGSLVATRAVLAGMKAEGWGRIVNISSNRAQVGFPRSSHYSAAKAAILGFTKGWALELAPHGILVNAVAPGVIRTGMTEAYGPDAVAEEALLNPLKAWAEPEHLAASILYLMGPTGDFTTGQVLTPNGGDPIVGI
ncbi:SDR family NAD(P)-dependent oxidoreductase [Zavarzinia sp. CC-PAN008]|uniref:SDR family NAD(P)-dependent oxidoreductase n=1 Tax=Zavarzinia sp. CC-PAN008 TaxID=3243332 RepID=UPI003F7454FF